MPDGGDRRRRAVYVLAIGLVIIVLASLFLFYVVPKVVSG